MSFWRDIRNGVRLECDGTAVTLNGVTLPLPPAGTAPFYRPTLDQFGNVSAKASFQALGYRPGVGWFDYAAGQAIGAWSVALDYSQRILWEIPGATPVQRQPLDRSTTPESGVAPYSSAGIYDIRPGGTIIMSGYPEAAVQFRRADGSYYTIPNACVRGDWVAGYANSAPIGVVAGQFSTGRMWQVWEGDPLSLPIRLDDDGQTVAISGPAGAFVPFSAWTVLADEDIPPVSPCEGPTFFAGFAFNGAAPIGNAAIAVRPTLAQLQSLAQDGYQLILDPADAGNVAHDVYQYFACNLEGVADVAQALKDAHAHAHAFGKGLYIYLASPAPAAVIAASLPGDVLAPWVYRDAQESLDDFRVRLDVEYAACLGGTSPADIIVAPILGCVERYGPGGTVVVTSDEAEQALAIGSQVAFSFALHYGRRVGVSTFRTGTSDHKPTIDDTLSAFYNDAPAVQPFPPTPNPEPEPMPKPLIQDPLREDCLRDAGKCAAKFWNTTEKEGYQGCREANDAFRSAIPVGVHIGPDYVTTQADHDASVARRGGAPDIDGTPTDWIEFAGCRTLGVPALERQAAIDRVVYLRR